MDFVARAIEEAGVDEYDPVGRRGDGGLEVDAEAPFLVHHAHLDGVRRQAQQRFDASEQFGRECHFLGTVHLRLDDVDGTGARIELVAQVVHGRQRGDGGVEDALGDVATFAIADRRRGHLVADIAHEQQGTAMQDVRLAIHADVVAVGIQAARERLAVLGDTGRQVALHEPEPVPVGHDLVVSVDRRDGVLEIHDGRYRRLHDDVADVRGVARADRIVRVEQDFEMQAVVMEDQRGGMGGLAAMARQGAGIGQTGCRSAAERDFQDPVTDGVGRGVGVGTIGQRDGVVQELAREGDDARATYGVVTLAAGRAIILGNDVGAVQGVVKAAPARIGGIERIACVAHRHDKLRAGLSGDFAIDVGGRDRHLTGHLLQIADRVQEGAVCGRIGNGTRMGPVPSVKRFLDACARRQQIAVAGRQVMNDGRKAFPEGVGLHARAGYAFVVDEVA